MTSPFSLAPLLLLPALLGACTTDATPAEHEEFSVSESGLHGEPLRATLAVRADGRLWVPAFGSDPSAYAGLRAKAGDVLALRNDRSEPVKLVLRFDGPPMLALENELHLSAPVTLAPGQTVRWRVPNQSDGVFTFGCPTAEGPALCQGLELRPGASNPDWSPRVSVVPGLFVSPSR